MKLLPDELVPARFAHEFLADFDLQADQKMDWASTKNEELLIPAAYSDQSDQSFRFASQYNCRRTSARKFIRAIVNANRDMDTASHGV